jgi:hypothetical protein
MIRVCVLELVIAVYCPVYPLGFVLNDPCGGRIISATELEHVFSVGEILPPDI